MKRTHLYVLLVMIACLVGCDHTTKRIAQSELRGREPVGLVSGVLDLTYTENRDVGFSALRRVPESVRQPLVLGLGLLALPALALVWAFRRRNRATATEQLGYALYLAGALGNVLDRVLLGYVVDFIHLHHWPIFNVADACITAGVALLLLSGFRTGGKKLAGAESPAPS